MSGSAWRHVATLLMIAFLAFLAPVAVNRAEAREQAQGDGVNATVTVNVANVRSGPGTGSPVVGQLRLGATLNLTGRNAANSWWYGCCANGRSVWISNTVARASGKTAGLPIVDSTASQPKPATPTPTPTAGPSAFPDWKGEYFNDINLAGSPLLVRNDRYLDFNWGLGSPDPRVPADNFSVRWSRQVNFAGGHYLFQARTSDGVRIYLDSLLVLDQWHDTEGYPTYAGQFHSLSPGWHTVTVEYYERGGIAYATVWWQPLPWPQ